MFCERHEGVPPREGLSSLIEKKEVFQIILADEASFLVMKDAEHLVIAK